MPIFSCRLIQLPQNSTLGCLRQDLRALGMRLPSRSKRHRQVPMRSMGSHQLQSAMPCSADERVVWCLSSG